MIAIIFPIEIGRTYENGKKNGAIAISCKRKIMKLWNYFNVIKKDK